MWPQFRKPSGLRFLDNNGKLCILRNLFGQLKFPNR